MCAMKAFLIDTTASGFGVKGLSSYSIKNVMKVVPIPLHRT